ncbi:ImmA/IrrE family metallo-endopeptidase [Cytobacillus oceanisediminis]|uniref:ImmA/IrrE family metallo-endopeptidase n=1 Tax=Cytobacillus oceanisediminis TaxID=665099 RepID=UPI0018643564|nr:ImmA/IrrE family metallo-endopeptidase [Cytobacillus oceanisediminis]QOK28028.1 ImmA/IrrE family metallo-endopeptidase [Cytobacillus oceanisediminis]
MPIKKVEDLIKRYKTNCPFKIAEYLGIQIVFENLGKTLGYYNKNFRIKSIHINENAGDRQKYFICSHELGHAVCHPDANTPFLKRNTLFSTDKIEVEANLFAVRLLFAPEYINQSISLKEAIEEYGVPEKFINKYLDKNFLS